MNINVVDGIATVTMTVEELGIIRYALADGVEQLERKASYHKRVNPLTADSVLDTAKKASAANEALESATQEWCHRNHEWCKGILKQCIRCGAYKGQPSEGTVCDPTKLDGKTESCCECGEPYPTSDLIAGEIFCSKCRVVENGR